MPGQGLVNSGRKQRRGGAENDIPAHPDPSECHLVHPELGQGHTVRMGGSVGADELQPGYAEHVHRTGPSSPCDSPNKAVHRPVE